MNTETISDFAGINMPMETSAPQANVAPDAPELGFVALLRDLSCVAPKQQTERTPMPSDDMDSEWVSWLQ